VSAWTLLWLACALPNPEAKVAPTKDPGIAEAVSALVSVELLPADSNGAPDDFPPGDENAPTERLRKAGIEALPALVDALADTRPTRTVTWSGHGNTPKPRTWRVQELAARLIWRISERQFVFLEGGEQRVLGPDKLDLTAHAAEIRAAVLGWYAKAKSRTPAQRKLDDLSDAWFRNRFDALEWVATHREAQARPQIEHWIAAHFADPKREESSLDRAEMALAARALGRIGDRASLPSVRRVCDHMKYTMEMTYRPSALGRWAEDSGHLYDVFLAYEGLALLGEKPAALEELQAMLKVYGSEMEPFIREEFGKRLESAQKDWTP
jgi:hypothetical protein